jgi:hypothetical protein
MIDSDIKKIVTNSISYNINKKMNIYDGKLDSIIKNLDNNIDCTKNIIEILKLNNNNLEQKIENLEEKIYNLENIILNLNLNFKKNEKIESCKNDEIIKNMEETKNIITSLNNENVNENKYKDLKEESFNLDNNFVKSCLDSTNIQSDIKIFKKMYIDNIPKEYYPIRHIKKKFQYWCDNHMNDDDTNGSYIKNIILKNIEQCYLKINVFDNYTNDIDQFLKNQEHINKLSEEKYKDKFLSKIISIINI